MNRDVLRLLLRILIDVLGIAIDVYIRCVWKPFDLPNALGAFLSVSVVFLFLYDILRCFVTILDLYTGD